LVDPRPMSVGSTPYDSDTSDSIKPATPDIILTTEDTLSPEIMTDLIFENIGGQELINISRNDIINGQNVVYQPIKNITNLYYQYNPQNVLGLQRTDRDYFKNFTLSLDAHIPNCGTGYDIVDGKNVPNCKSVYLDPVTKNLIINVVAMLPGEEVEVQIVNAIDVFNDTIY
jgi:hypothetical protein